MATGTFQTVIATAHGISHSSLSLCIAVVTDELSKAAKDYGNNYCQYVYSSYK